MSTATRALHVAIVMIAMGSASNGQAASPWTKLRELHRRGAAPGTVAQLPLPRQAVSNGTVPGVQHSSPARTSSPAIDPRAFSVGLRRFHLDRLPKSLLSHEGTLYRGTGAALGTVEEALTKARGLLRNGRNHDGSDADLFKFLDSDTEESEPGRSHPFISTSSKLNVAHRYARFNSNGYAVVVAIDGSGGEAIDVNRFMAAQGLASPHAQEDEFVFVRRIDPRRVLSASVLRIGREPGEDRLVAFLSRHAEDRPPEGLPETAHGRVSLREIVPHSPEAPPAHQTSEALHLPAERFWETGDNHLGEAHHRLSSIAHRATDAKGNEYRGEALLTEFGAVVQTLDVADLTAEQRRDLVRTVHATRDAFRDVGNGAWFDWAVKSSFQPWLRRLETNP